jgi:uncharacterized membrane protein YfcA
MMILLGAGIAFLVGLTGIGAGSITVPVLILLAAEPPARAVRTALIFTILIKVAVAPVYLRRKQVDLRALGALCAGGIPGVVVGVAALSVMHLRRYENSILMVVGVMIAAMAAFNAVSALRRFAVSGKERRRWLPWVGALIGAEVGFSSAGAGALGSLALMNFTSLLPAEVTGTDLWFGMLLSGTAGGWRLLANDYNPGILWPLAAGGLAGVYAGAALSASVRPRALRLVLSIVLLVLGSELCLRGLR